MIEASFDTRDIDRAMREIERRAVDAAPLYRELGKAARRDQREHQARQAGPDGRWPEIDPDTRSARRRKGRRRKRLLGRLPTALRVRPDRDGIVIRSQVRWSSVHQDGGVVGRGARIPARSFLWWSGDFLDLAADSLLAYALRGWSR